ncbi:adenylyl cyclase-associated protein [Coleophoma crateriformis]|uniref:Adenylyl cyclase-associated protein n=1 Tax=Coleophoma crateriformis TaxID=565419 RepID=A0A3D8T0F4_9HELO|nr:adenylyl cyclase-associated protein [Coleophoma crateriformis]
MATMDDKVVPTIQRTELTALINRLEAATSRLEDIASSAIDSPQANGAPASTALSATAPAPTPSTPAPPAAPKAAPIELPEQVEEFDAFISTSVKKYMDLSKGLGGAIAEQASSVLKAFEGQRRFLLIATQAKKPDMGSPAFMQLLKPLQDSITAVNDIRDANRGKPDFNQLSAVSESISVVAWVTVDPKPHKHVEESLGSAQYYGNRVLKEFKEKDPKQIEWIQTYYQIFKDLTEYVKQTYPSGIIWNPKGVSADEALKSVGGSQAPTPSAGGPPPPPPPPPGPPPKFDIPDIPEHGKPKESGIGAVFNDLNKGEDVTKGLRKVDKSQMTHKNPSLRAGSTVPTRSDSASSVSSVSRGKSPAPGKKPKPESMRTKKPPVKRLDGNKWLIENFENEPEPIEIEAEISHSILISRCSKTTIMVKGKANAISVDNSPRLSIVVESLVSSVDVIKCNNFALQVLGTLPTILMDQVDGAQVYLGKDSMDTEVFSSKSSGINLNIIDAASEEGDYKEVPLPEQLRTYITKDGKVASEIVEHAG